MDEIAKMLVANSPLAVVLLLLGNQVIMVAKEYLAEGRRQRLEIMDRLSRIEKQLGLTGPPINPSDIPF